MIDAPQTLTVARATKRYVTCNAIRKHGAGNCTRPAGWGTDHAGSGACKLHGGSTRNHGKHAQLEQARRAVDLLGVPVVTDANTALQDALDSANGLHLACQQLVRESIEDPKLLGAALRVYAEAIDRLTLVAKTYAGVGVDERRTSIEEAKWRLTERAVREGLATLGLDASVLTRAERAIGTRMRELTARN